MKMPATHENQSNDMGTCHIKRLPQELLLEVTSQLSYSDYLSLRCSNKHFAASLAPRVLRHLSLESSGEHMEDLLTLAVSSAERSAVHLSRVHLNLLEIPDLDKVIRKRTEHERRRVHTMLGEIDQLDLVMDDFGFDSSVYRTAPELLQATTHLSRLRVEVRNSCAKIENLTAKMSWTHLRCIELCGLETWAICLLKFLTRMWNTLRILVVERVHVGNKYGWFPIFDKLANEFLLDEFRLRDRVGNVLVAGRGQEHFRGVQKSFGNTATLAIVDKKAKRSKQEFEIIWKRLDPHEGQSK